MSLTSSDHPLIGFRITLLLTTIRQGLGGRQHHIFVFCIYRKLSTHHRCATLPSSWLCLHTHWVGIATAATDRHHRIQSL